MNLKKFEDLVGRWTRDAAWLQTPPTNDRFLGSSAAKESCASQLSKLISDTEDEMLLDGLDNDYGLCDGCGKPIEATKMFHGKRCVMAYSRKHAKDHGKDNEDE